MIAKGIEHIGIAVKSLKNSILIYEKLLGVKCYATEKVEDQFVNTAFFLVGQTKIELLESTDSAGPISSFIEKRGEGVHHLAFFVDDTNESLANAKENGGLVVGCSLRQAQGKGCSLIFCFAPPSLRLRSG